MSNRPRRRRLTESRGESRILYDSSENRQLLVEDGLIGAISTYSVNEVFLYPVIDNLILLLQQPLIVSFYHRSLKFKEPVFTTLLDPGLKKKFRKLTERPDENKHMVRVPRTDYLACFHTIDTSGGIKEARLGALPPENLCQFEQIFNHLYSEDSFIGLKVLEAIGNALKMGPASFTPAARAGDMTDAPAEDEICKMMEPMRKVINEAYADYKDSPLIAYLRRDLPITNLFCVIRNSIDVSRHGLRDGVFDYTARVILSDRQKEQVAEMFPGNARLSEYVERPLGMEARSLADSVFASGVLDFSSEFHGQGRDQHSSQWDSPDRRRNEAERLVYGAITTEAKIFYIPIHVAGVPWLALFTLTPAPADPKNVDPLSWGHNSLLYQILIPRIAERLRAGARLAYLQLIGQKLSEALSESDYSTLIPRVNKAWKRVLRVYPHHGVRIVPARPGCANPLTLPDDREVCLELYENPYYSRKINYDLLDLQHVQDVCRTALEEARRKQVEVKSRLNEEVLSQRHTIFNRTSLWLIEEALNSGADELCGTARAKLDDARRMTGVLETSLWIALKGGLSGDDHPLAEVRTVIQLLRWLERHTPSFERQPQLRIAKSTQDSIIPEDLLTDAFTVLWNLWHNASKKYGSFNPTKFRVDVAHQARGLTITFINEGHDDITQPWLDYLLHKQESPKEKRKSELRGLEIVNQRLINLRWKIDEAKIENKHTHIRVLIPN